MICFPAVPRLQQPTTSRWLCSQSSCCRGSSATYWPCPSWSASAGKPGRLSSTWPGWQLRIWSSFSFDVAVAGLLRVFFAASLSVCFFFICLSASFWICLPVCLLVYQCVYMFVWLFINLSTCLSACLSVCLPVCLIVYQSICLFVSLLISLSTCLSACLSVYLYACLLIY